MKSLTLVKSVLGASCFDRAVVPGSSQADRENDAGEEIVKRWVAEIVKRTWTEIRGSGCYPSTRILTRASRMLTLRCRALSTALTTSFSEKRKFGCFQSFQQNWAKYVVEDNTNQEKVKIWRKKSSLTRWWHGSLGGEGAFVHMVVTGSMFQRGGSLSW